MRLELTTSAVTGRRSNQLSHWAKKISKMDVELAGELGSDFLAELASRLSDRRS